MKGEGRWGHCWGGEDGCNGVGAACTEIVIMANLTQHVSYRIFRVWGLGFKVKV